MKKLLFICLSERNRSPTSKRVFNKLFEMFDEKEEYQAVSAGILEGRKPTQKEIDKAYKIIAIDGMVANAIKKTFNNIEGKLIQWSIPDKYVKDSGALIEIIERYYLHGDWK